VLEVPEGADLAAVGETVAVVLADAVDGWSLERAADVEALEAAEATDLVDAGALAVGSSSFAAEDFAAAAGEVDGRPTVTYPAVGPVKVAEAVT